MRRLFATLVPVVALAACTDRSAVAPVESALLSKSENASESSRGAIVVSSSADAGAGTLRDAIARANANPNLGQIVIRGSVRTIALRSPLTYTGRQALKIVGGTATLDAAAAGGSALVANGGGNLSFVGITVRNAPDNGITVEVPAARTGVFSVSMEEVTIVNNAGHGVYINDQLDPSTPEDANGEPFQPDARGSDASVQVELEHVRFEHNGYSVSDRDGLRVNEGGLGDILFESEEVVAIDNAADGIELDERGEGDVRIDVEETLFQENGRFDPADLDDGFDIDEADAGGILGTVRETQAIDNFEEGLDFNENNLGDLRVDFIDVVVSGSGEEGIDLEEDDETVRFAPLGGDLVTTMRNVVANGNVKNGGEGGIRIREKVLGHLTATIDGAKTIGNKADGIDIREDLDGDLTASLSNIYSASNTGYGIDFEERAIGSFSASLSNATATLNGLFGVRARAGTPNALVSYSFSTVTLAGNIGGTSTGLTPTIVP